MAEHPSRPAASATDGNQQAATQAKKNANKFDVNEFWGTPESFIRLEALVKSQEVLQPDQDQQEDLRDVCQSMQRSLGKPPLPGHEAAAQRWFAMVYGRAAFLAEALAAADELNRNR